MRFSKLYEELKFDDVFKKASKEDVRERRLKYKDLLSKIKFSPEQFTKVPSYMYIDPGVDGVDSISEEYIATSESVTLYLNIFKVVDVKALKESEKHLKNKNNMHNGDFIVQVNSSIHTFDKDEEYRLIGPFKSEKDAKWAVEKLKNLSLNELIDKNKILDYDVILHFFTIP